MRRYLLVIAAVCIVLALPPSAKAQAFPTPMPLVSGPPGAKLCTYLNNTTTPLATYTDATGTTANTNPVIIGTDGLAPVWLGPYLYSFTMLVGGNSNDCVTGTPLWSLNGIGATFSTGGTAGYVQYSLGGGLLGGDGNLTWNKTQQTLSIIGTSLSAAALVITNGYALSTGGFDAVNSTSPSSPLPFNVMQAPYGGMLANSFTAKSYVQVGQAAGAPAATLDDTLNPGALSWDTNNDCSSGPFLRVYTGSAWSCLNSGGGGGGGSPGGPTGSVQINTGTAFGGYSALTYNSATQLLTVTALSSSVAGLAVGTGFAQADMGFLATSSVCSLWNCFQAPTGGFGGVSVTATAYVQTGSAAGAPTATSGDTFHAGALSWDTNSDCSGNPFLRVYNGTSWICLGGSGSSSPGGSQNDVQFSSSGSFGGVSQLQWCAVATGGCASTGYLQITAPSSSTAGLAVITGFAQADQGFLATSACTKWNCFNTANGGFGGINFTATTYIQAGTAAGAPSPTSGDTFHAGALSWDSDSDCSSAPGLRVYNGSTWVCLGSGGGSSGVSSLTGTANQVLVNGTTGSAQTGALTLTLPQSIATTSAPTFDGLTSNASISVTGNVVASGTLNSTVTGSSIGLAIGSGSYVEMDGQGNISEACPSGGSGCGVHSIATSSTGSGGLNVTGSNAQKNSIQTTGGINAGVGGGANGVYELNGTTVINTSGAFVGAGVNVGAYGVGAAAFNVTNSGGGIIGSGQSVTVSLALSSGVPVFVVGGTQYSTLTFQGGILTTY